MCGLEVDSKVVEDFDKPRGRSTGLQTKYWETLFVYTGGTKNKSFGTLRVVSLDLSMCLLERFNQMA